MITGSTAAGEAIPPHFQFQSKAQEENKKINVDALGWMKTVQGQFGKDEAIDWHVTYGANEKAGMNNKEFQKYVETNLMRLYPDAADLDGNQVIIKVDSGPGRDNVDLVARLRIRGFLVYPEHNRCDTRD